MRRALIAVLMAAAAMMLGAAPADAGGPTSVLLTNPGRSLAAALYASDPRYTELATLLHEADTTSGEVGKASAPRGLTDLNITWLVHDVSVWRTDQLRIDRSGGAWVATSMVFDQPASNGPGWKLLDDDGRTRDLVASLGLLGAGRGQVADRGEAPAVVPETGSVAPAAPARPAPPVVNEETRWFTLAGWRWAVPGLLLGLMASFLGRGRRTGQAEPRQELIDGPPLRVTTPG